MIEPSAELSARSRTRALMEQEFAAAARHSEQKQIAKNRARDRDQRKQHKRIGSTAGEIDQQDIHAAGDRHARTVENRSEKQTPGSPCEQTRQKLPHAPINSR